MNLEGKNILVVGLGKTGEALCQFLQKRGAKVKVSDKKTQEELGEKIFAWKQKGIKIETGKHSQETFMEADLIVPSPGVPWLPEMEAAKYQGTKIISEIELAYRFLKGKLIGITGSNGKSTTATLAHKILKEGGLKAFLAGNIGTPLISYVETSQDNHIYVTEISSFQLALIEQFRVGVSVFLNITPDHLDWHPSFDDYYKAKKRLITSQKKDETAILNRDDPLVWKLKDAAKSHVYAFTQTHKVSPGCFLQEDWIVLSDKKDEKLMKVSEIPLFGIHNQENIMASALIGHFFNIPLSKVKESIKNFKGLEHRLEKVASINRVNFYNDSKATNVGATLKSIQSFKRPIILILGGRDKGGNFQKLRIPIKEKVKRIILIGEAKEKIRKALNGTVSMSNVSTLREAIQLSYSEARPGDIVLLSPACTSFDMFESFEERGKVFKKEISAFEKRIEKKRI